MEGKSFAPQIQVLARPTWKHLISKPRVDITQGTFQSPTVNPSSIAQPPHRRESPDLNTATSQSSFDQYPFSQCRTFGKQHFSCFGRD